MSNDKHLAVMAVCDESGDATFWHDGFVYVVDESQYTDNMKDNFHVSGLDCVVDDALEDQEQEYYDNFKHKEADALVYAVSLKELIQAAIDSGLMDTLQRKTRFNRELDSHSP